MSQVLANAAEAIVWQRDLSNSAVLHSAAGLSIFERPSSWWGDLLRWHHPPWQPLSLPGNLTLVHIKAPLWHEPHAPLRLFAAEGVEVVNIGGFVRDLKVANAAVSLQEMKGGPLQGLEGPARPVPVCLLPAGVGSHWSHPIAFPSTNGATEQCTVYSYFFSG